MIQKLEGKKALVIGAGISGVAAYNLLAASGAIPVLYDGNADLDVEKVKERLCHKGDSQVVTGELPEYVENETELLVLSPGVPVDGEIPVRFYKRNIPVLGEIELAYIAGAGRIVAITGTNGKTTTTALTGKIMEDYFGKAYVVGNIGIPYTGVASELKNDDVVVAEVSSFQLETIDAFRPCVSAVLNVTPDHLNRHHTMENYIAAKAAIGKNQDETDFCVLNYEDEITRKMGEGMRAKVLYFSSKQPLEDGCFYEENSIFYAEKGKAEKLFEISEMKLLGMHNVENVMAAILISHAFGVPLANIIKTVKEFRAVEHRIEYVCTRNGVDYYNDSKGTNPDAAIKGISAMNRKTVLIGGGYDKDSSYDEWIEAFQGKVKALVLIGQTADKIEKCARSHGFNEIYREESLEAAVLTCAKLANPGEAVLLSPACASWGMFPNYEVRGRMFKEYAQGLKDSN
ncbi:MAG: UDP-N-acetylmuramoyl-L-alanine--D-glutamate ligase [Lachnospiraceae bacterium]|nr:UDP-N-acetylmuramoyl-L-alanine--D-glutamate ligase [Lachnospiraceae bacterium]